MAAQKILTKNEALALAQKDFGQYNIYVRENEIVVRDDDSNCVIKIPFATTKQLELF